MNFRRLQLPSTPPGYQPPSSEERAKLRNAARVHAALVAASRPKLHEQLDAKRAAAAQRRAAALERAPELAARLAEQEKTVSAKLAEIRKDMP